MTTTGSAPVLAGDAGPPAPRNAQEFSSSLDRFVWIAYLNADSFCLCQKILKKFTAVGFMGFACPD